MKEINRLLCIKGITTTPYHPMTNGLLEHFHLTLKQMLKKLCAEEPKQWDRYLDAVLFAYREVPHESLGFSPFELMYGRTVKGPMHILKELWTKEQADGEMRNTYEYIFELRNKLEDTCKLARQNLQNAQSRAKHYYDKGARPREMKVGDTALVLLPTDKNKLLMQWKGPFPVIEKIGLNDYRIDMNGKEKVFHINLLKKYIRRETGGLIVLDQDEIDLAAGFSVVESEFDEGDLSSYVSPGLGKETYKDVQIYPGLGDEEKRQVEALLVEFSDIFTDVPGLTDLVQHKIVLTDDEPVRKKPYPIPYALREAVRSEVGEMLQLGIIEPSESDYNAPIVIVKKPDGSIRFCCDFRGLNLKNKI